MRHNKAINHLGRKSGHRKALLANMATSLILHKRIQTTVAKAKALKSYVEPLITKSKEDTTHSRRVVFSYLKNKYAVTELFREIAPKIADRPGGYTRVLKTGFRQGQDSVRVMEQIWLLSSWLTSMRRLLLRPSLRQRRARPAAAAPRNRQLPRLQRLRLLQKRQLRQQKSQCLQKSRRQSSDLPCPLAEVRAFP